MNEFNHAYMHSGMCLCACMNVHVCVYMYVYECYLLMPVIRCYVYLYFWRATMFSNVYCLVHMAHCTLT